MNLSGALSAALAVVLLAGCESPYRAPGVEPERATARAPAVKPEPPPEEQRPETYTVKRGDTLYSIALDNGLDYRDLAAWNNVTDPAVIGTGQVLRMRPPASVPAQPEAGVQVQPVTVPGSLEARPLVADPRAGAEAPRATGDLLKTGPKAMKLPYSEENLAMLQRQAPLKSDLKFEPTPAPPGSGDDPDRVDWIWPASGRILAGFSEATNKGVDIFGKIGDPVYASAAGRVVYSGTGLRGFGRLVIIKHNQTYLSAYAHNSNIFVKEGQNVGKGQKIAEIGNTDSPQAKLHFEIRRLGKPVDPLKFLPERPS